MKTLKTLLAGSFILISMTTSASTTPDAYKLTMDFALKTYIDAVTQGKIKGFAEILDRDVKFTVTRGEQIINYGKSEMLMSLKNSENVKQNCQTSYQVVEQTPTQSIVKVIMKYEDFSRINFVTLTNTTKGWKITNVSSSFD